MAEKITIVRISDPQPNAPVGKMVRDKKLRKIIHNEAIEFAKKLKSKP